ncbi:hypothetical protein Dsin_004568 [Dipteronia sinensis]|uniref:RNase H type-1 domain-containing protein n=1 Tax=Dipteronia sinensis TaxID=43782 RepID=A0AAE0EDW2_9ROSI|nr:hypothetical protein Dsin_004568 [Dipteronia sinensis]
MHSLWECRKQKYARGEWLSTLHGSPNNEFSEVVGWCKNSQSDYQACGTGKALKSVCNHRARNTWRPLDQSLFKIYYDAAIDDVRCRIGIGIVIQDFNGFVLVLWSQALVTGFSAQVAGVVAIQRKLQFCKDCGLALYVLESDTTVVVKWINYGSHVDLDCGEILSDIWNLMYNLDRMTINCVPILANQVTYRHAKFTLSVSKDKFLTEEYSLYVNRVVSEQSARWLRWKRNERENRRWMEGGSWSEKKEVETDEGWR